MASSDHNYRFITALPLKKERIIRFFSEIYPDFSVFLFILDCKSYDQDEKHRRDGVFFII